MEHGLAALERHHDGNRRIAGAGGQPGKPVGAGMRQDVERERGRYTQGTETDTGKHLLFRHSTETC
jgi:hypothetical protein